MEKKAVSPFIRVKFIIMFIIQVKVTHMPKELMPKNLVVSFKDNKIIFELISPIGNSGIINLSNPSKEIYDTYLSLFTIRYFYASKPGE